MFAQVNGVEGAEIWDFLPYHDAPELTFDEAREMYEHDE